MPGNPNPHAIGHDEAEEQASILLCRMERLVQDAMNHGTWRQDAQRILETAMVLKVLAKAETKQSQSEEVAHGRP